LSITFGLIWATLNESPKVFLMQIRNSFAKLSVIYWS